MSDDFIPLNQSTPSTSGRGGGRGRHWNKRRDNDIFTGTKRYRPHKYRGPENHEYFGPEDFKRNVSHDVIADAYSYVLPSMVEDPWEPLRRQLENRNISQSKSFGNGNSPQSSNQS